MAEAFAEGLINPVFEDIEDDVKGLGVPGDIGLERIDRVTERNGGAVISGLGHGVICESDQKRRAFRRWFNHAHKSRQTSTNPIRVAITYRSELFVTAM